MLSVEIKGNAEIIKSAIKSAILSAAPVYIKTDDIFIAQHDNDFTWLTLSIPADKVMDFLTKSEKMSVTFEVTQENSPINIYTNLSDSRKALIFAANNCIRQ